MSEPTPPAALAPRTPPATIETEITVRCGQRQFTAIMPARDYNRLVDMIQTHQGAPRTPPEAQKYRKDDVGDMVCEHGTAADVHCCNCHSGFVFDLHHECPDEEEQ